MQYGRNKLLLIGVLLGLFLFTAVTPTLADDSDPNAVIVLPESGNVYHTVQYGEYLSHIAVRYGVTIQAILQANPNIKNPNLIYAGTVLLIPTGTQTGPPAPPAPQPGPVNQCRFQHYVSYGENLSGISAWYGVSPWAVAQANNLYNLNHIYAGTYLCIP